MKLNILNSKIVVNMEDGKMLGYIKDLDIDLQSYTIKNLIVENKMGIVNRLFRCFLKDTSVVISTKEIISIGNDIILVKNHLKKKG